MGVQYKKVNHLDPPANGQAVNLLDRIVRGLYFWIINLNCGWNYGFVGDLNNFDNPRKDICQQQKHMNEEMKNTVLNSPHSSGHCLLKCFLDRCLHSVWAHILPRFVLRKTPLLVVITIFWPNSGIKAVVLDPPISAGTPQGMGFYIFQIDSGTTQIFNFAQIYFHKMT